MGTKITAVDVHDVRFPTAAAGDGSDAINRGDYSATYVELRTDAGADRRRASPSPTAAATRSPAPRSGRWPTTSSAARVEEIFAEPVAFWRSLTADVQLRWLGPEKGVIHMAAGALVNAVWDLRAKLAGKPMWRLLAEMPTDELVASIDFHHITDALTPDEAAAILRQGTGRATRSGSPRSSSDGFPSYTTSVGWLGYPDDKVRALTRAGVRRGLAGDEDEGRRRRSTTTSAGPGSSGRRSGRTRC